LLYLKLNHRADFASIASTIVSQIKSLIWARTPVISALGRLRQDNWELEANLGYIEYKSNLRYTTRPCLGKRTKMEIKATG
jgi:hypothetical protein